MIIGLLSYLHTPWIAKFVNFLAAPWHDQLACLIATHFKISTAPPFFLKLGVYRSTRRRPPILQNDPATLRLLDAFATLLGERLEYTYMVGGSRLD